MTQRLTAADLLPELNDPSASSDGVGSPSLEVDLGHMSAFDPTPMTAAPSSKSFESALLSLSQSNVQSLINQLFSLPTEPIPGEVGKLALLPWPQTVLPREKPVPKPKAATKWEQFAKLKGIQKRKKGRMEYDETTGQYLPRWGYKSIKSQQSEAEWAIPAAADAQTGAVDPWTAQQAEKKARIAKNKKQQERNLLRHASSGATTKNRVEGAIDLTSAVEYSQSKLDKKGKANSSKKKATGSSSKHHVDVALGVAQRSTASMGRFDTPRKSEPQISMPKQAVNKAQRHEAATRASSRKEEKGAALNVLTKVMAGHKEADSATSTRINMDKIVAMGQQQNEKRNVDKKRKAASNSSKKGSTKKGGSAKKSKR